MSEPKATDASTGEALQTPLGRRMGASRRPTPDDLHALARQWWLDGKRFDIGQLARELGIGRATAFRWVGNRESLYGEVIGRYFEEAFRHWRRTATGDGTSYFVEVTRQVLRIIVDSTALRTFVEQDPNYAIRVLMSGSGPVQARGTKAIDELLSELESQGVVLPIDRSSMAWLIFRIGESFVYRDVLTGEPPDVEPAITAISILVGHTPER